MISNLTFIKIKNTNIPCVYAWSLEGIKKRLDYLFIKEKPYISFTTKNKKDYFNTKFFVQIKELESHPQFVLEIKKIQQLPCIQRYEILNKTTETSDSLKDTNAKTLNTITNEDNAISQSTEDLSPSSNSPSSKLTSLLKKIKTHPFTTVCGIQNPGSNNCFMNAAFQLIMNTPHMLNALITECTTLIEIYENKTEHSEEETKDYRNHKAFLKMVIDYSEQSNVNLSELRHLDDKFSGSQQCDASEFMNKLLDPLTAALMKPCPSDDHSKIKMQKTTKRKYRKTPINPPSNSPPNNSNLKTAALKNVEFTIKEKNNAIELADDYTHLSPCESSFGGLSISIPKAANSTVNRTNLFQSLFQFIPIPKDAPIPVNGTELFQNLFQLKPAPESATETAITVRQGVYNRLQLESERDILQAWPEQFIIDLKRFSAEIIVEDKKVKFKKDKIDTLVDMPEEITLTQDGLEPQKYELKSIVVHSGGLNNGHYISMIKKQAGWFLANDQTVSKANKSSVTKARQNGYIYAYIKVPNE